MVSQERGRETSGQDGVIGRLLSGLSLQDLSRCAGSSMPSPVNAVRTIGLGFGVNEHSKKGTFLIASSSLKCGNISRYAFLMKEFLCRYSMSALLFTHSSCGLKLTIAWMAAASLSYM